MATKKPARRTRSTHTPVKAQVSLAALREDKTIAERPKQFDVHPHQIRERRRQLVESASGAYGGSAEMVALVDLAPLHAKIGQLTLENDFLEALTKAGLPSAER